MINKKNKTQFIQIHEWTDAISVKVADRTRYAYNLNDFNAILKNEIAKARNFGHEVSISRTGCGKFRGITWKNLSELVRA